MKRRLFAGVAALALAVGIAGDAWSQGAGPAVVTSLNATDMVPVRQGAAVLNQETALSTLAAFIVGGGANLNQIVLEGTTSGAITVKPQAAAGTFNFNLPTTAGTSGQPLLSGGGGATAMNWGSVTGSGSFVLGTAPTISAPVISGHPTVSGSAPALSSCGTSPAIVGSDLAGEVTMGTGTPTGCVITFAAAFTAAPFCVVTWQANLASMQYAVSTTAITLTQTATNSNKVNYHCIARSGG